MRSFSILTLALLSIATSALAAPPAAGTPPPATPPAAPAAAPAATEETGLAAVYSDRLNGHKTASGQMYRRSQLTAAHKTLPFGTKVKVTNIKNGKSVVLTITDRGPREPDRILDISPAAAHELGILRRGMGQVKLEVVSGT
jgi:rare lipoprotein A